MAEATRRFGAARRYRALSGAIASAFGRAYVRADGSVGNGSQTGMILALRFSLLPPELRRAAVDLLVADIRRRGTLLSTGFHGTRYSLDVLADAGQAALIRDLLLRTAFPSLGYMVAHDATTIWERWNGDVGDRAMCSFNHYALGAVGGFLFRRIAGIDPIEPGFSRFRFDPVYDPRMPSGGARYESRSGLIVTDWKWKADGAFALDIRIPANARCTLCLPTGRQSHVREGGRATARWRGMMADSGNGKMMLDVGSGTYHFTVTQAEFG